MTPWTLRSFAELTANPTASSAMWTWDTPVNVAGFTSSEITQNFSGGTGQKPDCYCNVIAITGPATFIQSNQESSLPLLNIETFSLPFLGDNSGGFIIVDIWLNMSADSDILSVEDTNGNVYVRVLGNTNVTNNVYWYTFIAPNILPGANEVTIVTHGIGGGSVGQIFQWSMTISEYSGVTGVNASTTVFSEDNFINPLVIDFSLTVPRAPELLHAFVVDNKFAALVAPNTSLTFVTTFSPSPLIAGPPPISINDKTLPIYSLNFPMSNCEQRNPCRQHYPLL